MSPSLLLALAASLIAPNDSVPRSRVEREAAPARPDSAVVAGTFDVLASAKADVANSFTAASALRARVAVTATRPPLALLAVDSMVVEKSAHRLTLYSRGLPVRVYGVAIGRTPVGDKERRGDGKTPEGVFHIQARNAGSKYHLAFRLDYPDAAHLTKAASLGADPGGDIMIHGLPERFKSYGAEHRLTDWTEGCVALTNAEIEELWGVVRTGIPVQIKA